jgi:hypothetical protein
MEWRAFLGVAAAVLVLANPGHCALVSNKIYPASVRVLPILKSSISGRQTETMCEIHPDTVKNGFIISNYSYCGFFLIIVFKCKALTIGLSL